MSRKYKFHDKGGLYFVSFAVINWIDIFIREEYCLIIVDSLNYCRIQLGLEIYGWCIMPSHVHLMIRAKNNNPEIILGRMKEFTSKQIVKAIANNKKESRREWLLWMMKRAGMKSSNVKNYQFWQHNNKPIELWSNEVIDQKLNYIHRNPVVAGFVLEDWHWKYSSARSYAEKESLLEIDYV
ncbi:MAG: transposase [Chitinophagaceae bacterium]|nr:transposase [Chitinophagaceae bacterium]